MDAADAPAPTRRRGRRPADALARRAKVEAALAELTEAGVPFTMEDLAERAGISRATLYRDATLRDLVGTRGDGPERRPVTWAAHQKLIQERASLQAERRELRRALREASALEAELRRRIAALEEENLGRLRQKQAGALGDDEAERLKKEAYAEGFAAGTRAAASRGGGGRPGTASGLAIAAARLPRGAVLAARRTLARTLHPDLFATDPAAALLATEILKELNALAQR